MDTLIHQATNIGTIATMGGVVVPPVDETGNIIHLAIGLITGLLQLFVLIKKRKNGQN